MNSAIVSTKVLTDPVELSRTLQGELQTPGAPPPPAGCSGSSLDAPKDPSGLLPTTSAAGMDGGATALPPTFAPSILPSDSGEKTVKLLIHSLPEQELSLISSK